MKIRTGFVSNSSSSSFVIFGTPAKNTAWEYTVNKYCTLIVNDDYKKIINNKLLDNYKKYNKILDEAGEDEHFFKNETYENKVPVDLTKPMYLSSFISDAHDDYYIFYNNCTAYEYYDGAHGGPYDEDKFELIDEEKSIWIKKIDVQLKKYISDKEIDYWSSLQNAKLIGHNISDEQFKKLNELSVKMNYTLNELYKMENDILPIPEDIEYLMNNGQFINELCFDMKPRFNILRNKVYAEFK